MDTQDDKNTPASAPEERSMHHRRKWWFLIPVFVLAAIAVMGTVVMLLWNAIVPDLTGWGMLTWWKAVGLLVLCKILFGGLNKGRRGGADGPPWRRWKGPEGGPGTGMRGHLRDKWKRMTDEERQRMRDELRRRCGDRFRSRSRRWIEVLPEPVRLQHHGTQHALQASLLEARAGRRDRRCSAVPLPLPAARAGLHAPARTDVPAGVRPRPAEALRVRRALAEHERGGSPTHPRTVRRPLRTSVARPSVER
ncbi:MAG: hypothetical protein QM724_13840 [Flavobacteriales bacterium]